MSKAIFAATGLLLFVTSPLHAQILSQDRAELYALVLAPIDLTDATRVMTVYDPDEDGFIDQEEQKRLPWRSEIEKFDLSRDGKISHLEVTVRFAKIRADAGIEQKHVNNASVYMRRHDKNGNGQLDPEEVGNPWPSDPEEFDFNKDGIITLGEMAKRFAFMAGLRREMGIEQVDQVTAIRTVRKHDQDKDQRLDDQEQKGAFLPLPASEFDEDNDGKVGIMEIATMLAKHRRATGMSKSDLAQVRSLFERFDASGDGVIDESEFQAGAAVFNATGTANPLASFDLNSDGRLTQYEVQDSLIKNRKSLGFNDDHLKSAKKLMTRHDKNQNTFIEDAELYETPVSGQLNKSIMKRADQDDDKRITLIELAKYLATQDDE